jgi:hypothetical protein
MGYADPGAKKLLSLLLSADGLGEAPIAIDDRAKLPQILIFAKKNPTQ